MSFPPDGELNKYAVNNSSYPAIPFTVEFKKRDPTFTDVNYPIQKVWLNETTDVFWFLRNFYLMTNRYFAANWIKMGGANIVESLRDQTGIDVLPDSTNEINVIGDGVYIKTVGNPSTNTLTIEPAGALTTLYTENTGTATPMAGNLNVLGSNGITTTGSGNTITISPTSGTLFSGNTVDAHTAPGTNPVVTNGSGLITVTGGQIAAGTTTNVIRTDSLAANTFTVEVQRSQAVGSSTIGDNGVSHFNSAQFAVDGNGFVSLATSFFRTGNWSPNLAFGGASVGITYGVQYGEYTVIGNLVFYTAYIELTSKGSSTGTALITNLPFTSINAAHVASGTMGTTSITLPSGATAPFVSVVVNSTQLELISSGSGIIAAQLTAAGFTDTSHLDISGFYFTS